MRFWSWLFGWNPCLRQSVLLNLHDDTAIRGVLFTQRGRWLVLKRAELLQANQAPVPLDGDVVLECATVSFIQVVGS